MRNSMLAVLCVLLGLVLLQGCETVKGVSRDIDNTANNVTKLANSMNEQDNMFTEKYW